MRGTHGRSIDWKGQRTVHHIWELWRHIVLWGPEISIGKKKLMINLRACDESLLRNGRNILVQEDVKRLIRLEKE